MGTRFRERGFSSGGKIVGSDGFSQNDIIWEVDFRRFPLSDGTNAGYHTSLLTSKGLTLARASSATVQTSTSTITTTGLGVDAPRLGDAGYGQGLVIESSRTNLVPTSREIGGTGWTQGTGNFETGSYADGPDGSVLSADRLYRPDGLVYSDYVATAVTAGVSYTGGFWARGTSGASGYNPFVADVQLITQPVSAIWTRKTHTVEAVATTTGYWQVQTGTPTAAALDIVCDLHQLEVGKFATEVILTSGASATRAGESISVDASRLVRAGRIGLELEFVPKAGTLAAMIDSWGNQRQIHIVSGTYSLISCLTGTVSVVVGGNTFTTTGAITHVAGDTHNLWIEAGGGLLATRVVWRKKALGGSYGSAVVLGTSAAPQGNHTATGSLYFLGDSLSRYMLDAWVKRIVAYTPGRRPTWAA
jgi:hypothetical protein